MRSEASVSSTSSPDTERAVSSPKSALGRLRRKLSSRKAKEDKRSLSISVDTDASECGKLDLVFRYFDKNGDGKISPAELQSCVRTVGGQLSQEEAETAVRETDMDGDGLLGMEEFEKLMEANGEEEEKNDLRDAFGMYEMEGSGCITPTSLKRMLSRLGESRTIEDCKSMIRMFDLNGDGVLNFEEFTTMMR